MIVTAHQANFLPGASVMGKIAAADVIIWEDELQFTRGYENRNRLPSGKWLTVPVAYGSVGEPLNRVRIAHSMKRQWERQMAQQIQRAWPGETADLVAREVLRPYRQLIGLNTAILRVLCDALEIGAEWQFQSHLEAGHFSEFASERLADMVVEVGGDTYLSGPSGRNYLDEAPFRDRGLAVEYWRHAGDNPCALSMVRYPDRQTEVET